MAIDRKEFCAGLLGGGAALWLGGCGGGGSYSAPAPPPVPAATCGASGTAIAGNHGHALNLPSSDLGSTVDKTYSLQGAADHDHTLVLSAAQLQQLKPGATVVMTSSTTNAHSHVVTVSCV